MKILFLDWACFNREESVRALEEMGHEVTRFVAEGYNDPENEGFLKALDAALSPGFDCVFSYNYFPLVARGCHERGTEYISFLYDSPYTYVYSYTITYSTNHIFLFDSTWAEEFIRGGLKNVHYMVLPGDPGKVRALEKKPYDSMRTKCDLSFVGTLYNERHNFYERLEEKLSPYLKGYLEGIIQTQMKLYGMDVVEPLLTADILEKLQEAFPSDITPGSAEPASYRYSNYFIKRKITQLERKNFLTAIGERFGSDFDLKLFTVDPNVSFAGFKNMGVTPYETEMPLVFRDSRINLNITLRSITSGIPLRCMDIMSCGGFLLSNYQQDLVRDFIPGEDFDYYSDTDDMLAKIEYYLSHEKERAEIAANGMKKTEEYFSFKEVFNRVFSCLNISS